MTAKGETRIGQKDTIGGVFCRIGIQLWRVEGVLAIVEAANAMVPLEWDEGSREDMVD